MASTLSPIWVFSKSVFSLKSRRISFRCAPYGLEPRKSRARALKLKARLEAARSNLALLAQLEFDLGLDNMSSSSSLFSDHPTPPPPASPSPGKTAGPGNLRERDRDRERDRIFALHLKPSRPLTRSNAVAPKTPDQHLDLPTLLTSQPSTSAANVPASAVPTRVLAPPMAPPPSPSSMYSRTGTPSLRNVASLSISSSVSNDFLTVQNVSRRRHSDSYFPTKRHNRRNRLRGKWHSKFSYSPNPRLVSFPLILEKVF